MLGGVEQTCRHTHDPSQEIWMRPDASGNATRLTSLILPSHGGAGNAVPLSEEMPNHQELPRTIEMDCPGAISTVAVLIVILTGTGWKFPAPVATPISAGNWSTHASPVFRSLCFTNTNAYPRAA